MMPKMKHYLSVAALLSLSACISFGGKPPPSLLTLTSTATVPANPGKTILSVDTIAVNIPATPQAIATTRVAVSDGATAIAYVQKAAWVEAPARLFQRLLGETITAKTGKTVLDPRQSSLPPALQLNGQLLRFGVDAGTTEAVIIYDAILTRDAGKTLVTRRFEARSPATAIEGNAVGVALNRTANQIAGDIANWVGDIK